MTFSNSASLPAATFNFAISAIIGFSPSVVATHRDHTR
jgi:hypothetical protein